MRSRILVVCIIAGLQGCTPASRSPDAIRQDTAEVTATAARDAKAVAQGLFDGLSRKGPLNINTAAATDLQRLPGIGQEDADRIMANRPYGSGSDLLRRHLISKTQYDRISDKIVVK